VLGIHTTDRLQDSKGFPGEEDVSYTEHSTISKRRHMSDTRGKMSKIAYRQQMTLCGKPRCRTCQVEGGHGPYWYAYRVVDGRTIRTYVGRDLPQDARTEVRDIPASPQLSLASSSELAHLRVYTLGRFRIEYRRGPAWYTLLDSSFQDHPGHALLRFLFSSVGRRGAYETVLQAVWPKAERSDALSRMETAIRYLRELFELRGSRQTAPSLLATEREVLMLANQAVIWVDADAFEQLTHYASDFHDLGAKERIFEEAIALYEGHYLPEEHKIEATLLRRESLQTLWVRTLLDLSDLRFVQEELSDALLPLERLLALIPTHEETVRRLMSGLVQRGQPEEAVRVYKRLAKILRQEYSISPLPETRILYKAVQASERTWNYRQGQRREDANVTEAPFTDTPETAQPGSSDCGTSASSRQESKENTLPFFHHRSQFVGRDQELEVLRSLLLAAEGSAASRLGEQTKRTVPLFREKHLPHCAFLIGKAGIGKTRLMEECGREVRKRGWLVAWGRGHVQEEDIHYRVWIDVLRWVFEQSPSLRQEIRKHPLLYQPLAALLPEMHSLLPSIELQQSLSSEQEQQRLWEGIRGLLVRASEERPLLLILDDLQFTDGSSCELIAYLARRITGFPLVLIGTTRDHELSPGHPLRSLMADLQRDETVRTLVLHSLSDELVTQMLHPLPLPNAVLIRIQILATGNPYFAEELAKMAVQEGEAFSAPSSLEDAGLSLALPESIKALFDLQLQQLSEACQQMLTKAAVLGYSFDLSVIRAFVTSSQGLTGPEADSFSELLEEAKRMGILVEERKDTRTAYQFCQPLLVSHLYGSLSAARRESLHRRAARVLQEQQGE